MCVVFAVIAPYLICAVNPAIIVTKIKSGGDIRKIGSGNAGLTNTLRTQGKTAALVVLLIDVFKGVISIVLVRCFFKIAGEADPGYIEWVSALSAVLGHSCPVYYGFKGGKSVLVMVSVLFVLDWKSAAILLSLFAVIVLVSKYVSLGSVIAAAAMPFCVFFVGTLINKKPHIAVCAGLTAVMAALLVYKHRGNIKKLMSGTENKLGKKRRS